MKKTIRALSLIVVLLGLHCLSSYSQDARSLKASSTEPSLEVALQVIASTNAEFRLNAAIQLDGFRNQLIHRLISVLKSTNDAAEKIEAVIVLGEYRAEEAIPILIEHLEWDDAARGGGFIRGIPQYEAASRKSGICVVVALTKIGMPAVPALLDKAVNTSDEKTMKKCVHCCCVIEGKEVTRKRLEDLQKAETNPEKKKKIDAAIINLNSLQVRVPGGVLVNW